LVLRVAAEQARRAVGAGGRARPAGAPDEADLGQRSPLHRGQQDRLAHGELRDRPRAPAALLPRARHLPVGYNRAVRLVIAIAALASILALGLPPGCGGPASPPPP